MSHKHFLKSNKEEVLKMLKWIKEGLSFSEIGRRLHRNHTTIMYWVHKVGPNNIYPVENLLPDNVIIDIVKKEKKEIPKVCQFCKGKKSKKWKLTKHCCMLSWYEENKKPQSYLYW
jgi:hypothetical protein